MRAIEGGASGLSEAAYLKYPAKLTADAGDVLGAPGGAGAAHVVQFGPVRIECLGKELAPEGAKPGEGFCLSGAAGSPGCEGMPK